MPTHQTYFEYVIGAGGLGDGGEEAHGRGYSLGNGHGGGRVLVAVGAARWRAGCRRWARRREAEIEQIRAELVERHGPDRAERIAEWNRNMLIYPNTVINDIMAVDGADLLAGRRATSWRSTRGRWRRSRSPARACRPGCSNFLEFLGPGGFATPDDVEALESCQIGFDAGGERYNDISRGMLREAQMDDELQMRAFWRQWAAQMERREIDDWSDAPPRDHLEARLA